METHTQEGREAGPALNGRYRSGLFTAEMTKARRLIHALTQTAQAVEEGQ